MKKIVNLIVALVFIGCIIPVAVRADVIYEPRDSFYNEHREECTYVCRTFTANGPNGEVIIYKRPESAGVVETIHNGNELYISYTYEDDEGILWGCCESWETDLIGWAPMDYLIVVYDGISFAEEFGDQFVTEEGSIGKDHLGQKIFFWEYPGSEVFVEMALRTDPETYLPEFSTTYTDEQGVQWGRCSYYMGIKGYWINLNDPSADFETLYPEGIAETVSPSKPQEEEIVGQIVPKEPRSVKNAKIFAAVAVAAVVAVTGVLLAILKRKRK